MAISHINPAPVGAGRGILGGDDAAREVGDGIYVYPAPRENK